MLSQPLRQVATYTVPPNVSLRIFEEQSSTSSISRLLIAEPLLDWQRDEQGRPLINAVSRVQGGGAVFELRLIISTMESQQAAQRAVSADEDLQKMKLITQIDSVNLALAKGNMGELLEFTGGEMYPSRNENVVLVDFESSSLTANEGNIEKVRSILRSVRLICKASVNGHQLPPINLDFSSSSPAPFPSLAALAAAAVAPFTLPAIPPFVAPTTAPTTSQPRIASMPFPTVFRLARTPNGNLIATTDDAYFYILKNNGEELSKISGGAGLLELRNTTGVAVLDDGTILIADGGTCRVNLYTPFGGYIRSFGGPGNAPGQFNVPSDIAVSKKTGFIFITDVGNGRVQVFDKAGNFLYLYGSLLNPRGIDIDDEDNVYVAESTGHRVRVFTPQGTFLRLFGIEGSGPGQLSNPQQIFIDRVTDRILVADMGNKRYQAFRGDESVESVATNFPPISVIADKHGKVIVGGYDSSSMMFF